MRQRKKERIKEKWDKEKKRELKRNETIKKERIKEKWDKGRKRELKRNETKEEREN